MQFIKNIVDQGRKLYAEPGAPLHKVWPLLDAAETFLLTPGHTTGKKGVHVRDYVDLKRVMVTVIIALIPCFLWSIFNVGQQHFVGVLEWMQAGNANPYTLAEPAVGWLQWLLMPEGYNPLAGIADAGIDAVPLWDKLVFGLQQMLPIVFVSYFVGLNIEGAFAVMRKEEISEGYLVTGMLVALIVPPSIPLWQLAIAVAFSVVLVKEIFGGTGSNIFNVALMARAFLFFAYPAQISGQFVWVAGNGETDLIDGYTKATPLAVGADTNVYAAAGIDPANLTAPYEAMSGNGVDFVRDTDSGVDYFANASDAIREAGYSWSDMFVGLIPGSTGETSALLALLGGVLLLVTKVASWRIMLSGVIGLLVTAFLMNLGAGDLHGIGSVSPFDHLVMGGFAFGIVFMATDPVTAPETELGRIVYGFLIGAVSVLVRAVNPAYPEGVMLAILLLNAFSPTIDHFVVAGNIRRRRARLG